MTERILLEQPGCSSRVVIRHLLGKTALHRIFVIVPQAPQVPGSRVYCPADFKAQTSAHFTMFDLWRQPVVLRFRVEPWPRRLFIAASRIYVCPPCRGRFESSRSASRVHGQIQARCQGMAEEPQSRVLVFGIPVHRRGHPRQHLEQRTQAKHRPTRIPLLVVFGASVWGAVVGSLRPLLGRREAARTIAQGPLSWA